MDKFSRRGFLSFIPALGAIPFIGTEVIKEKSRIILLEPEPIIKPNPVTMNDFNLMDCEVKLMYKGQEVSCGFITNLTIGAPIYGPTEINLEAKMMSLNFPI
jgi:hypothetical protein